ncbi:MAG: hypothetical protein GWN58_28555 [Anaerolineae bacterium]|nr:hypothetical protein [Anaerolineae bacterium]
MARKNGTGLFLLLLFFLFTRRSRGDGGGSGQAPATGAPAQVAGSAQRITVEQGQAVTKNPGDRIGVNVSWRASTTDADGNPIPWTYRVRVKFGHNTTFGWRTCDQLGFSRCAPAVVPVNTQPGSMSTAAIFTAPDDPDQEWDIRVDLEAKESLEDGTEGANWVSLVRDFDSGGVGAVRTVSESAFANTGGSISSISVSQDLAAKDRLAIFE